MTSEQIKRILEGLGYHTDETIQTPEIRALILSTNQGINHRQDFVTYDSEDNLICIKRFEGSIASGRITNNLTVSGTTLTAKSGNIYLRHTSFPFRSPKVGDTVFLLDKNFKSLKKSATIVSCSQNQISLSTELTIDLENNIIVYADSKMIGEAVQDAQFKGIFFEYDSLTNNSADIYLEGDGLLGIEMQSELLGSV